LHNEDGTKKKINNTHKNGKEDGEETLTGLKD